jgi:MFS family permease
MGPAILKAGKRTFRALGVRNFRLYFAGQLISMSGTWMQMVAQAWLVLKITNSAVYLGLVVATQFLPMLLFGTLGGLIVDRSAKRPLLFATQSISGLLALSLAILDATGHINVTEIFVIALLLGCVNVFDTPARQTFVQEMVGRELLPNAVSLNSVLMNSGRIIGPAIAGGVIAAAGTAVCFFVNAGSFLAVIAALGLMDTAALTPIRREVKGKGQLRAGLGYAFHDRLLRSVLIAVGIVGVFVFNFTVSLPLLVRETFHGNAASYGLLMAGMGLGAVIGGLVIAHRQRPSIKMLVVVGLLFGLTTAMVGLAPSLIIAQFAAVLMGAFSIAFVSTANATLQMASREEMRGRVLALFAIGFLGSTPIGAPLVGVISSLSSPRVALVVGATSCWVASGLLALSTRGQTGEHQDQDKARLS